MFRRYFSEMATPRVLSLSPSILDALHHPTSLSAAGFDCQNSSSFSNVCSARARHLADIESDEGGATIYRGVELDGELVNSDLRANETRRSRKSRPISDPVRTRRPIELFRNARCARKKKKGETV